MIWTVLVTVFAIIVAMIPALGCAILAVTLTAGFGPDAQDRAGKRAVAAFLIVWPLASWGLIEWLVI